MICQEIHTGWNCSIRRASEDTPAALARQVFPLTVPACAHTAMLSQGAIDDPHLGENWKSLRWVGKCDWTFSTTFDVSSDTLLRDAAELCFDGIDTIARIVLNDRELGRVENMHTRHRFDVKPHLRESGNTLVIEFESPIDYARAHEKSLGTLPWLNTPEPFNFIRKMACSFGWDWAPPLESVGIWKGVRIEAYDIARIAHVRPLITQATPDHGQIDLRIELDRASDAPLQLEITLIDPDGDEETQFVPVDAGHTQLVTFLDIDEPRLWWPRGHGEQPLYELRIALTDADQTFLHESACRVGIRTTRLDTSADDIGSRFILYINDKPIYCKGWNWIPDDSFITRACTPERYQRRLQDAIECDTNMLRVWGGGIFETDTFYDLCDELGIMVWQDCLFACAGYPEEEPFWSLVTSEVRDNVNRLASHASLVIWNGCNENLWGYLAWQQFKVLHNSDRTWGPGYYFKLIDGILRELDPSRPYWPASPYSGDQQFDTGLHPNLDTHGNKHVWEAWFGEHYGCYRRFVPRFCSEFGFQAPPTFATLSRVVGSPIDRTSAGWKAHQHSGQGDQYNHNRMLAVFDAPESIDDYCYLLQCNQARALTLGVEWWRSFAMRNAGTLIWQLNDCCPAISWSAIDGDSRRKPLWYAARRFFADRLLTIQPGKEIVAPGDPLFVKVHNDSDEPWHAELRVRRMNFDGTTSQKLHLDFEVPARQSATLLELSQDLRTPIDPSREFIAAEIGPLQAVWFFLPDRELKYDRPVFEAAMEDRDDGYLLKLSAQTLIRDLCLFVDRLDPEASVDEQWQTVLPGATTHFAIKTDKHLTLEQLTTRPVMNCCNWFGLVVSAS